MITITEWNGEMIKIENKQVHEEFIKTCYTPLALVPNGFLGIHGAVIDYWTKHKASSKFIYRGYVATKYVVCRDKIDVFV